MNGPTQRIAVTPISEEVGICHASGQWLLEDRKSGDPVIWNRNELNVKVCGQDGFGSIAQDIRAAQHSIDIICYGFDPATELERGPSTWPRGTTFGDLLAEAAGKGLRVRVLCWYGPVGAELRGFPEATQRLGQRRHATLGHEPAVPQPEMYRPARHFRAMPGADAIGARREFNISWFEQVVGGGIANLSLRTRYLSPSAAEDGVKSDPDARAQSALERFGMDMAATHHQKTVLIDHDLDDGRHAVGYVMGLNSLTDYWDTAAHLFNDPRRGASSEGDGDGAPSLKPYQDYACQIRGEALADVHHNFCDAWNRATASDRNRHGADAVYRQQKGLAALLGATCQRAQIVRTQSQEKSGGKTEQSIRRLYQQATKQARKYVYVENQYFQYTPWAEQLKAERKSFCAQWSKGKDNYGKANTAPPPIPWLHVMIVTPTPEKGFMVPRTHDTVKALGNGESMLNQDKAIEDELRRHREDTQRYEQAMAARKAAYAKALREPQGLTPYEPQLGPLPKAPEPLSPLARDSQALGEKGDITKQLKAMRMRTLVASLWTFDHDWPATHRKERALLEEWKDMPHQKDRYQVQADKLFATRYREIYIHSKLMLIDDGFFTLGSANLNQRSMASDSEINVATDDVGAARALRQRVWQQHTKGAEGCNPPTNDDAAIYLAFDKWVSVEHVAPQGRRQS